MVLLQTIVNQEDAPRFHVDPWTENRKSQNSLLTMKPEVNEPTRSFRDPPASDGLHLIVVVRKKLRLTWVKLDQPSAAVTEVSAHFGGSVLHLHRRQTLSFRPVTSGSLGEEPLLPGWPRMPDQHFSRCAQSGSEVLPLTHRFCNRWQTAGPGTRTDPVCGAEISGASPHKQVTSH